MRRISFHLIFISLFCISAFAQTNQTAPCSAITVTGPASVSAPGETMIFTANTTTDSSLKYEWTVTAGTIVEGQNSPVIRVATTPEMAGATVTATVEVKGLPENCAKTASEWALVNIGCGLIIDFDDYEKIPPREERLRLTMVAARLAEQPATSAIFIIYFPKKETAPSKKSYLEKVSNILYQTYKIPKDRLVFATGEAERRRTRIIIVPNDALDTVTKSEEESLKKN